MWAEVAGWVGESPKGTGRRVLGSEGSFWPFGGDWVMGRQRRGRKSRWRLFLLRKDVRMIKTHFSFYNSCRPDGLASFIWVFKRWICAF